MNEQQLIVTDLDGTLLNDDHQVPQYVKESIDLFQKNNGIFTFATGRMNESVQKFALECQIKVPIITYNGAQLYCPVTERIVYEKTYAISTKLEQFLIEVYRTFAEVLIFSDGVIYTFKKGAHIKAFEKKENVRCEIISEKDIPREVTKIIIISDNKGDLAMCEKICMGTFHEVELTYSEPNFLEILPLHTSKGIALHYLKSYLQMDGCYTTTFGNHLNDISLFQASECGVAVQNAIEEVKENADIVLQDTNVEGAIGYYIENKLIKKNLNDREFIKSFG
ncbi:MAG TPA: Cof-type HAD-IIB family hydrolase [Candidatus Pseudogracilibacillus intestinigallinarum]|uniref:Cof-type HAD-IIB family hydrolase n=1 Tax=Candidatus Pseudogracilibacillus intestinigallinarum TaxID=2838742 RepID=A0A9D1PN51_9BACI|nr:Cof-type HAD-IIB family hydrolase [Candidatus Pseudogracilibacillus intestinigallinarum]